MKRHSVNYCFLVFKMYFILFFIVVILNTVLSYLCYNIYPVSMCIVEIFETPYEMDIIQIN